MASWLQVLTDHTEEPLYSKLKTTRTFRALCSALEGKYTRLYLFSATTLMFWMTDWMNQLPFLGQAVHVELCGSGWHRILSRRCVDISNTREQNANYDLLLLDLKIREPPKGQEMHFITLVWHLSALLSILSALLEVRRSHGYVTDNLKKTSASPPVPLLLFFCIHISSVLVLKCTSKRFFLYWRFYNDFFLLFVMKYQLGLPIRSFSVFLKL